MNILRILTFGVALSLAPMLAAAAPPDGLPTPGGEPNYGVKIRFLNESNEVAIKGQPNYVAFATKRWVASFCEGDPLAYFTIGQQTFKIQRERLQLDSVLLKTQTGTVFKDSGEIEAVIPRKLGCQDKPVALLQATVIGEGISPVMIEENASAPVIQKYIGHMSEKGDCKTTKYPQVIGCFGSKDNAKTALMFFLPLAPDGKLLPSSSAAPIHARCDMDVNAQEKGFQCAVHEYFDQQFRASTPISNDNLSKENILAVRKTLLGNVKAMMVAPGGK